MSQTCIRQDRGILTMMRSCASAAKLRAAGPFLSVGIKCQVRIRRPAASNRQFGSRAEKPARVPNGAECYARSGKPFQDAGRKTAPSSGSPVMTQRRRAMISLRASAVLAKAGIMVLRVPIRLAQQPLGGLLVAAAWHQDVEHDAGLVHRSP